MLKVVDQERYDFYAVLTVILCTANSASCRLFNLLYRVSKRFGVSKPQ